MDLTSAGLLDTPPAGQPSPVLDRWRRDGLAVPVARLEEGTDRDLYRAVSRCSLKRSAAISALESSCRGMLLISEENGLSGFSRLISQLVLPGEGILGKSIKCSRLQKVCTAHIEIKHKLFWILQVKIKMEQVLGSPDTWQNHLINFLVSVSSSQSSALHSKLFKHLPW